MAKVQFVDRETGALRDELVFGERELRFLYENGLGRGLTDHVFSAGPFNHLYGLWQRSRLSRRAIPAFVRRLGIDPAEAAQPLEAYRSLDDFFTRHLRPGARPIDPDPDHLLAPADGRTLVLPRVTLADELAIKGSRVRLAELLADPELAARYDGGAVVVVRLAPADYHRFHFPADGVAGPARRVGRRLHSVHPIALDAGAPSFVNKRVVTTLETERFGRVALIEVGAMVVGTIVQTYRPGSVARGEEKGTFRFGGSTVVMLIEPDQVTLDEDLVARSAEGMEVFLKVGTRVARRAGAPESGAAGGEAPAGDAS